VNAPLGLFTIAGARESALAALTLVVAGLLVIALAFALAVLVLRVRGGLRRRRRTRLAARWEEAVLQALEDPTRIAEVHERVDSQHRMRFVQFTLDYVRRVRGEGRAALRDMVAPYLEDLVPRSRHRKVGVRARAVQTLGTLGLPRHAAAVLAALADRSEVVAMVAARALARSGSAGSTAAVLAHLHRFARWSPQFLASMLASMAPEATEQLRKVLRDGDRPAWLRAVAADALRLRLDLGSADVAATVVVTETDRDLVAASLRLLAAVGRPVHFSPARSRAESPDDVIRAAALGALAAVGGDDEDAAVLVRAMADSSPWVGLHAARGLRAMGRRSLLADLASSADPRAVLAGQVLDEEAYVHD
jgi:HEAT repeat protein